MAAPFVYVPEASPSLPHNPYYATPQGGPSPFLPPSAILYPSSPYLGSTGSGSAPGTPENFNANSVLWPEMRPSTNQLTLRLGRRSLIAHARLRGTARRLPPSPFLQPAAPPAFVHSQSAYFTPGHRRSASWGNATAPPPPSWLNAGNPYLNSAPQTPLQIHPWLNGDTPSPVFHFDLAPGQFAPLRMVNANPPQSAVLGVAEISEPAFHPPLNALRILHPRIPFWPVDLALPEELAGAVPPPISLGDVLVALHRSLHERISHADWAALSAEDEQAVTKAFVQRCRAEAVRSGVPPAHLRDREVTERNQGVKRVDFLLGKTVFKGLVRAPGIRMDVRMVTA
ncbi:hypothetical protein FB451DRAFT_1310528 [Mycena latifolia]|nr:hypothetical protein FB451DRAFT_1310528 [Mycena latifolia]